jgi:hypothetical protein
MDKDIFQKIESSPRPDFSDILSKSFDLFKKVWESALYHALILMAIVIPFIMVVYIPMIFIISRQGRYNSYVYNDSYEPSVFLLVVYAIIVFALIFVVQAISLGIIAHFYRALKKADLGTEEDIGGYFVYLKGENLSKVFLISIATFLISITAVLLCYLPIFYVMVPLQIIQVIFAFNEKISVSDMIRASFKLGNKYWLIAFGLIILSSFIAQLGILLCVVGIFVTAFFVHLPMYYFYKDTIGFDDEFKEFGSEELPSV